MPPRISECGSGERFCRDKFCSQGLRLEAAHSRPLTGPIDDFLATRFQAVRRILAHSSLCHPSPIRYRRHASPHPLCPRSRHRSACPRPRLRIRAVHPPFVHLSLRLHYLLMMGRFGRIVRCDIPAPRQGSIARSLYAFVEYEDWRAAEDAFRKLHGKPFGTGVIRIQWARTAKRPEGDYDERNPRGRDVPSRDYPARDYAGGRREEERFIDPRDAPRHEHRRERSPPPRRPSPRYDSDVTMGKLRDY